MNSFLFGAKQRMATAMMILEHRMRSYEQAVSVSNTEESHNSQLEGLLVKQSKQLEVLIK